MTFVFADDDIIQDFLWNDGCAKITDKVTKNSTFHFISTALLGLIPHHSVDVQEHRAI